MTTKQTIENVRVKGRAAQASDAPDTEQSIRDTEARSAEQEVTLQQQSLQLGKFSAHGKLAVIALAIIALGYVLYRYLSGH